MSHPGHSITVCICGNVLSQCRCMDADKTKIVSKPCKCTVPGKKKIKTKQGAQPQS